GQIVLTGQLTSTGNLAITTPALSNSGVVAAGSTIVNGSVVAGSTGSLTITGAQGLSVAGTGTRGTMIAPRRVNLISGAGSLSMTGTQIFNGIASLIANGANGSIDVASAAALIGSGNINLATGLLSNFGSITSTGGAVNLLALNGLTMTGQGQISGASGIN